MQAHMNSKPIHPTTLGIPYRPHMMPPVLRAVHAGHILQGRMAADLKRDVQKDIADDIRHERYMAGHEFSTQFIKGTTEEEREVRSWAFMHRPARIAAMGSYVAKACGGTRKQQAAMWPTVKAILERYSPEVLGVPRDLIRATEWRGQRKTLASILGLG